MLWMETPPNPLLEIYYLKAIAVICKEYDIIMVVDNTLMTPYFQKPLDLGATIVIQSVTKYLAVHSDVMMGAFVNNNEDLIERVKFSCAIMGLVSSPMDCYLVLRYLKLFLYG